MLLREERLAIKSFADERTLSLDRGEFVAGASPEVRRRIVRALRILEAAPDLETLRSVPSFAGATLVSGACSVPVPGGWRITFVWSDDDAWLVRAEEG